MNKIDEEILKIFLKKRRRLSASRVTKLLNEKKIEISRPTVTKKLKNLKKQGWLVDAFKINPDRLP